MAGPFLPLRPVSLTRVPSTSRALALHVSVSVPAASWLHEGSSWTREPGVPVVLTTGPVGRTASSASVLCISCLPLGRTHDRRSRMQHPWATRVPGGCSDLALAGSPDWALDWSAASQLVSTLDPDQPNRSPTASGPACSVALTIEHLSAEQSIWHWKLIRAAYPTGARTRTRTDEHIYSHTEAPAASVPKRCRPTSLVQGFFSCVGLRCVILDSPARAWAFSCRRAGFPWSGCGAPSARPPNPKPRRTLSFSHPITSLLMQPHVLGLHKLAGGPWAVERPSFSSSGGPPSFVTPPSRECIVTRAPARRERPVGPPSARVRRPPTSRSAANTGAVGPGNGQLLNRG